MYVKIYDNLNVIFSIKIEIIIYVNMVLGRYFCITYSCQQLFLKGK